MGSDSEAGDDDEEDGADAADDDDGDDSVDDSQSKFQTRSVRSVPHVTNADAGRRFRLPLPLPLVLSLVLPLVLPLAARGMVAIPVMAPA